MVLPGSIIAGGYLLGAIPFGVIIARYFYGINIREHGSKNPGATNVWRVLGKKPGIITLALDILKGVVPVVAARQLCPGQPQVAVLAGLAAIIGHNWSIFLMGSGGKGVATSAGVFLALLPLETLIALAVFALIFFSTRIVSVGSMCAALALLAATLVRPTPNSERILVSLAALMLFLKHIPNLKRLARGEENRVPFK